MLLKRLEMIGWREHVSSSLFVLLLSVCVPSVSDCGYMIYKVKATARQKN